METNKPEQTYAAGGVRLAIWKNTGKTRTGEDTDFFSINLERRYLDSKGQWQSTTALGLNDIPKAQLLLHKAYEFIALKPSNTVNIEK